MASYNPNNLSADELSCPICFEEFTTQRSSERVPKLLLCLHTFCLGCVRSLVKSNKSVQCSICRTEHTNVVPQDLFDNYVIINFVRKQQEEDDARFAQEQSELFRTEQSEDPAFLWRQQQLCRDAELARQYQMYYDKGGDDIRDVATVIAPTLPAAAAAMSAPTISVAGPAEVLCMSQDDVASPEQQPQRSTRHRPPLLRDINMYSSSTTSTASSSAGPTHSPSSSSTDDTSSEVRSLSASSSSSRLDDEFVDSVETLDNVTSCSRGVTVGGPSDGGATNTGDGAAAAGGSGCSAVADVNVSSSSCASVLSAAYTDTSGFSRDGNDDDAGSDVEEQEQDAMHLQDTFTLDDEPEEDELFNNLSALEDVSSVSNLANEGGASDIMVVTIDDSVIADDLNNESDVEEASAAAANSNWVSCKNELDSDDSSEMEEEDSFDYLGNDRQDSIEDDCEPIGYDGDDDNEDEQDEDDDCDDSSSTITINDTMSPHRVAVNNTWNISDDDDFKICSDNDEGSSESINA